MGEMPMTDDLIRAAVLHGVGQTPRYEQFPAPVPDREEPDREEVVVTVRAAALKPYDIWMARGAHPAARRLAYPRVVGADGVGMLADGTRVAFFGPVGPYGGMAERALVRAGVWFPVPEAVDDVTAAGFLNPAGSAWKTVAWEGGLKAGQSLLVLGATGAAGRIAVQVAHRLGARVVAAGRDPGGLGALADAGADAVIRVDRPHDELVTAIADAGPFDLVIDYLWGAPAEAALAALAAHPRHAHPGQVPARTRYISAGMSAGETLTLPAMSLRAAAVEIVGSGTGDQPSLAEAAAAYTTLLPLAASGEIDFRTEAVPLAEVEKTWNRADRTRRIVYIP
jgi:NADPH:quinone reductase-like Zn-dependent oxidoreductase